MGVSIIKVTAHISTPVAGAPPLDSLLEYEVARRAGISGKIDRRSPVPDYGSVPVPIAMGRIGGMLVARCTSPILSPHDEYTEHFAKRLDVSRSIMVEEPKRRIVSTGSGALKAYRLPLRLRDASRIVWFAVARRKSVFRLVRSIKSIGHKRSQGFGKVSRWDVERCDEVGDVTWFAKSDSGQVLMRPLPLCSELPADMVGAARDFGAVQPPYWHPDRNIERVVPC